MASFLDNAAFAIAEAAGWKQPVADEQGRYSFSLRGGLDMQVFSPDGGNTVVVFAAVQDLPKEERTREDLLLAHAQRAVAACKDRATTLALEDDRLVLQRVLHSRETALEDMPGVAKSFLNDLDWWRAQAARLSG